MREAAEVASPGGLPMPETVVRVGQVWEHPLGASRWVVRRTDLSVTKVQSEAGGWLWVSTPGLTDSWRLIEQAVTDGVAGGEEEG